MLSPRVLPPSNCVCERLVFLSEKFGIDCTAQLGELIAPTVTRPWQIHRYYLFDCPWPTGHDYHPVTKKYRLVNVMGYKHHGSLFSLPDSKHFLLHLDLGQSI